MGEQRIVIPYAPRPLQRHIHASRKRFSVLVCHRRFGKTVLAINELIKGSLTCTHERPRLAYIAPTYKQAKQIAWDYLKHFSRPVPGVSFNEAELRADYPNGGRVTLYGADNPDSLRGLYLDGVVIDEPAQCPQNLFPEIIRPSLADRKGWCMWIGTPKGRDAFCDLYEAAARDPEQFTAIYRASETGIVDPDELSQARAHMSDDEYNQEFECSFDAAVRGAYFGRLICEAEAAGRVTNVPYDPVLPVHTFWDLGVGDATAIWFIQAAPGGEMRAIDYYEADGEGLTHYAKVLRDRGYVFGEHWGPHDLAVRELGTGKSRLEVARSLGIDFRVAPNLPVDDGIEAVRLTLPRTWFDKTRTAAGLEALRQYRREFNARLGEFKGRPLHDWTSHAADAFRYFAVSFRERRSVKMPAARAVAFNSSSAWMGA